MATEIEQLILGGRLLPSGTKVPADFVAGVKAWGPLSKISNTKCMYNMAFCHRYGKGAELNLTKARELYEKAAGKGEAAALFELYTMIDRGEVDGDTAKAQELLSQAVNAGEARALCVLGDRSFYERKKELAMGYYKKGSDAGFIRGVAGVVACGLSFDAEYKGDGRIAFTMSNASEQPAKISLNILTSNNQVTFRSVDMIVDAPVEVELQPPYESFSGEEAVFSIGVNGHEFRIKPVVIVDWAELISPKTSMAFIKFRMSRNKATFNELLKASGAEYFKRKLISFKTGV